MSASVELILQAKRIYIIGVRSSTAIADFLNFYFRNIFENVAGLIDLYKRNV